MAQLSSHPLTQIPKKLLPFFFKCQWRTTLRSKCYVDKPLKQNRWYGQYARLTRVSLYHRNVAPTTWKIHLCVCWKKDLLLVESIFRLFDDPAAQIQQNPFKRKNNVLLIVNQFKIYISLPTTNRRLHLVMMIVNNMHNNTCVKQLRRARISTDSIFTSRPIRKKFETAWNSFLLQRCILQ